MNFKVNIVSAKRTVEVPTGGTILNAALDTGIGYPFGCQSGNCGACKSHLLKGEVTMEGYSEFALSDEEKDRGLILACRAVPWADSEVAWLEEDDLIVHPRRVLACKVIGLDDATHDIKRVRLSIESGGPFDFSAGQFASVTFSACQPRDYSMANVPGDSVLEFHVRRTQGGTVSTYVADTLKVGDEVRVEGPFGASYLRESHRGPIIAVAGGSGMAPLKSIVERAIAKALPQHIYFYFGVRSERDLYLEDHFKAIADAVAAIGVNRVSLGIQDFDPGVLGLLVAIPQVLKLWFGQSPQYGTEGIVPDGDRAYNPFGDVFVTRNDLATIGVTVLVVIGLTLLFRHTALGLRMRAVVESPRMTSFSAASATVARWAPMATQAAAASSRFTGPGCRE